MKKSIKSVLAGLLVIPVLVFGVTLFTPITTSVNAVGSCEDGATIADGVDCTKPASGTTCLFGVDKDTDKPCAFTVVTNAALYVIGAVSVLMLIYGGIRYTTSGGNEKNVTAAKNTILYAVVGIIVAVMAYAIVNFVIGQFVK